MTLRINESVQEKMIQIHKGYTCYGDVHTCHVPDNLAAYRDIKLLRIPLERVAIHCESVCPSGCLFFSWFDLSC